MIVQIGNVRCKVVSATQDETDWLAEYLSFPDKSFQARGDDDARISMLNELQKTFPSGFWSMVRRAAKTDGIKVEPLDKRKRPCEPDPTADLEWLRHHPATDNPITHQIGAVDAIVKQGRGIIWVPTGGGKGQIAIGLTKLLPCRWLFLVHRKTLMHQIAEAYRARTGKRAGLIGDGVWKPTNRFNVATYQTLHAMLRAKDPRARACLENHDGVICDEAHVTPAVTILRVVMATQNAYWRVGLSATPLARGDKRSIWAIGALGPVVFRVPASELMDVGIMARAKIRMVPFQQRGTVASTWHGVYSDLVVRSTARNKLLTSIALRAGRPGLLFVQAIKHGRLLTKRLQAAGLRVQFVWGTTGTHARRAAVKDLEYGDLDFIVCSSVFQEGLDVPELRSVINGAAGKSVIAALQRVGRGGRATENKTAFEVWDVLDGGDRWLQRHARARRRAYLTEGYSVVDGRV